jgi:MerR family transcriptional regulator, repressor of the yfmOP operon
VTTVDTVRIGEAARRTGLTPRTLRYYEEMGLLRPCSAETAASRRYSQAEIDRIERIRELQDLLGLSLGEIRVVLESEDTISSLRERYHRDASPENQRRVVAEAIAVNEQLLERLDTRIERIRRFRAEVAAKLARRRARARELERDQGAVKG